MNEKEIEIERSNNPEEQTELIAPTPQQKLHPGILLTLFAIIIVLLILLVLGILFLKKNLDSSIFTETSRIIQSCFF